MKSIDLKNLLLKLKESDSAGSTWLGSVPRDINDAFFDNEFVNCMHKHIADLQKVVFGSLYDDIGWFLYEWQPGYTIETSETNQARTYVINNIDDYIEYLLAENLIEP
jgi:hypothetical protein